ncbi:helix-turn-helix transcriptional regulator [Microbacterium sp. NEAU-LLC]|uniref:Helix-turn-helix transcriptional regulator n=1 Tax=Microbacterium helvum TaxID=2773713 RepID=A0ABR8NU87_9MICO|nr:helix-turn-helix transcriptional regulator [Microbacterium helvum]MBD3943312.1 helix-turn-helix transcriptional regulator [Microbacterium helvum]
MLVIRAEDFGNIVRDRRNDLGLSQKELGERVEMSRQWIVRFENGHAATATFDHILRIAEALDLDIEVTGL